MAHNHNHTDRTRTRGRDLDSENQAENFDVAYSYLSNALRWSFFLLKIIMIVLVILFVASGITYINNDERALVLRFGKIRGVGDNRILGPGLKMLWPYPINEVIRVPVEKTINLSAGRFWYHTRPGEEMPDDPLNPARFTPDLDPLVDGYCIVRGSRHDEYVSGGNDYGIAHCKWVVTYKIENPEKFFRNVFVDRDRLAAGQNYGDLIERSVKPLLNNIVSDAVVTSMVNYTIEEAMNTKADTTIRHVERLVQKKLDDLETGIKIVPPLQRPDFTWPRQVGAAFRGALKASNEKERTISEAKLYAEQTLSQTAGPVAQQLFDSLSAKSASSDPDPEQVEQLWSQVAGQAADTLAEAQAYRTKVVEDARASADYLHQILPEYRKRPKLVLQKIYRDAIEQILDSVDEKMVVQPTSEGGQTEFRISISRDQTLKPKLVEPEKK